MHGEAGTENGAKKISGAAIISLRAKTNKISASYKNNRKGYRALAQWLDAELTHFYAQYSNPPERSCRRKKTKPKKQRYKNAKKAWRAMAEWIVAELTHFYVQYSSFLRSLVLAFSCRRFINYFLNFVFSRHTESTTKQSAFSCRLTASLLVLRSR